jgi:hypothetical protein
MSKKTWKWLHDPIWIFNIVMLIVLVVLVAYLIREKAIPRLWADASVRPSITLPTPISDGSDPYEYCVLQENAGLASKLDAGTPVPMEPVTFGSMPTAQIQPEPEVMETPRPSEPTPTLEPTATQPVYNELDGWQVEVVDMGEFKKSNYHVVVVGVGFSDVAQNEAKLREIISGLEVNFAKVRVDFAYVPIALSSP